MTCDYKHSSKYSEALVIYMEMTGFSLACIPHLSMCLSTAFP